MYACVLWGGVPAFVSAAPRLWQIHRACGIRGLASLAMLTADTFHTAVPLTAPLGSISPTVGEWLAGGGRELCLLCKGSSLPLLCFFLYFFLPHSPPTFISHMVPPGAIIWQHPPPTRNHLLPHDKHAHTAITPQENALASSGCTVHLIIRGKHHLWVAATHIWLTQQNKDVLADLSVESVWFTTSLFELEWKNYDLDTFKQLDPSGNDTICSWKYVNRKNDFGLV